MGPRSGDVPVGDGSIVLRYFVMRARFFCRRDGVFYRRLAVAMPSGECLSCGMDCGACSPSRLGSRPVCLVLGPCGESVF